MASKPARGFVLASRDLAKIGQKYLCNSCTYVLRDPVQTECGHHYCRQCLNCLLRKSNAAKCLKDGTPLTETSVFSDACIAREVLSFSVHCVYVEDGCAWIGEIRVLERHLEDCPYVRVACIIPSCGVLVKRNSLAFHLENDCSERVVKCSYCELSFPFSELKVHETTNCKLFPETCGVCMKKNIPREELKFHYDECEEVEIECAFAPIGCKEKKKMKKGEREAHMSLFTCFHLTLLLRIVLFIKDQIQWVLSQLKSLSDELASLIKLKETVTEMMSQIAALIISNTEIREELKSQETRTKSLEVSLTKQSGGEVIGGETIRQRLRNHTGDMADDFALLKRDFERLLQSNEIMQTTIRQLQRELQSQNQVVGLSSVNMTELEQNLCRLESTSYEGILLWKIKGFAQKRREAINGVNTSFYSPFFYTSRYGYKMCARIYLNGDGMGKGTHISLFFVIARGEYDALLRWPFRQKVTMMILDQNCMEHMIDAFRPDPASSSFQRPSKEMNIASGCPLFCPLDDLNKHGYVRDDCMFVKIIVDTTDY